jgi:DNA repair protein SbcD/Mre11
LKLLCAADLHIGRRPWRLAGPVAAHRLSSAVAWDDLVDLALGQGVDCVLLAGDVVDQANRYFEAFGPLGRGLERLKAAGIAALAVAGNHDHQTLHEVAAEVGGGHLRVLGRGGRWERHTLRGEDGAARLHVDGWSFPDAWHRADPAGVHDLPAPLDDAPILGLLHCDLDGREDRYAPVPSASLARLPMAAWVLGHIHVPQLRATAAGTPVLYPGSLMALGPGETGPRGAWLLELSPGRTPSARQVPLSRVRYEHVSVDVGGLEEEEGLRGAVTGALRRRLDEVVADGSALLELVSCRVELTGRTVMHAEAGRLLANLDDLELVGEGGIRLGVHRVEVDTRPALDLHDLARGSDAPGLLARLLLRLDAGEEPGPEFEGLMARAARAAAAVRDRPYYAALGTGEAPSADEPESVGPPALRVVVRREASLLLDALIRQKGAT